MESNSETLESQENDCDTDDASTTRSNSYQQAIAFIYLATVFLNCTLFHMIALAEYCGFTTSQGRRGANEIFSEAVLIDS